jgi:putative ATP-dependent endonuclease of OLD family
MSTGTDDYYAPFHHQGTGTINTMVLALLSMIAEMKDTVIFAMEEPEIAIPPYTQKRIVNIIRKKTNQAIFTSHSPFVLEEFAPESICLIHREKGIVFSKAVNLPSIIKPKSYRSEFRLRFAEALLAKRVLITEGNTEATSYSAAAKRLEEINSEKYLSFEALGIAVFDAASESSIPIYGEYFRGLKKIVLAVFDEQTKEQKEKIVKNVDYAYEIPYKGFEKLIVEETDADALKKFVLKLTLEGLWPTHLSAVKPLNTSTPDEIKKAIGDYLKWAKGAGAAADLIGDCSVNEIPITLRRTIKDIKIKIDV